MNPEIASSNAPLVRGYTWHVYPDPATPGVFAGGIPFGTDEPPAVTPGWTVEAARISENVELDQRGDRSARLIRTLNAAETRWGQVKKCEFQVDRG